MIGYLLTASVPTVPTLPIGDIPVLVSHIRSGLNGSLWAVGANGIVYRRGAKGSFVSTGLEARDIRQLDRDTVAIQQKNRVVFYSLTRKRSLKSIRGAVLLPRFDREPLCLLKGGTVLAVSRNLGTRPIMRSTLLGKVKNPLHELDWTYSRGLLCGGFGDTIHCLTRTGHVFKLEGSDAYAAVFGWDGDVVEVRPKPGNYGIKELWEVSLRSRKARRVCEIPDFQAGIQYDPRSKLIAVDGQYCVYLVDRHGIVAKSDSIDPAVFCLSVDKGGFLVGNRGGEIDRVRARLELRRSLNQPHHKA
ncbi:MAG TPA: hypothetical protein VG944_01400 [Fimbriimonas sp.]|nr:hypothetical protein [Fimbriimonas sp.]